MTDAVTDVIEWLNSLTTLVNKEQRRAFIVITDKRRAAMHDDRLMDDPRVLAWVERGDTEPAADKPVFGL